jgi:hypothetical protein
MCGSGDYTEHCVQWRPSPKEKEKTCPINHRSGRRKTLCENFGNFAEHVIFGAQTRAVQPQQRKAVCFLYFSANFFNHCLGTIYVTNQLTSGYRVPIERSLQLLLLLLLLSLSLVTGFLPGTSLETAVTPALTSSCTLQ